MGRFLARRVIFLVLTLVIISLLTFWLFWATPADPAAAMCGKQCQQAERVQVAKDYGFDRPIVVQYGEFMSGLFHSREIGPKGSSDHCPWPCLGYSYQNKLPVSTLVGRNIMPTVYLAIGASIIWVVSGVLLGLFAALRRGRWQDRTAVGLALFGVSFPTLVLGYLLMYVCCQWLGILPWPNPENEDLTKPGVSFFSGLWSWLEFYIMPWLTLAGISAAIYTRLTRASMIETMGEDYIRTARAKGLSERRVIFRHGLRAALTPLITVFGMDLGTLLGGAVLTEQIFSIQGLGRMSVTAVLGYDLPVLMAVVLLAAFFIITANIIVDVVYAFIDPRVRLQ